MAYHFNRLFLRRSYTSPQKVAYFISFCLWPFGVMMASLRHRTQRWSMNIFWLFCIFVGFTFVFASDIPDSARYANTLREFHDNRVTWTEIVNSIYSTSSNYIDVVQPIITWFVSLLTSNPSILLAVFGFIFGFFYSRNLWYLLNRIEGRIVLITFIFVLSFALINPIWNINGFRMNAAIQVFIYGLLPFLVEGKKSSLLYSASAILFHFSFIFPVAVLGAYLLIGRRSNFYFIFFIITFFINTINLDVVREYLGHLPEIMDYRVNLYANPNYAKRVAESLEKANWYITLSDNILTYINFTFITYVYLRNRKRLDGPFLNLFCFSTWLYGWANLASLIPAGARFIDVADMMMLFFNILFMQEYLTQKGIRFLRLITVPGLILFILVTIRMGFEFMSFSTIAGNPIISIFLQDNTPLIAYVKDLF